jgi:hypothetical protein
MQKKLKVKGFELFGDTPVETRDTQMCRDTMVENHWYRELIYTYHNLRFSVEMILIFI